MLDSSHAHQSTGNENSLRYKVDLGRLGYEAGMFVFKKDLQFYLHIGGIYRFLVPAYLTRESKDFKDYAYGPMVICSIDCSQNPDEMGPFHRAMADKVAVPGSNFIGGYLHIDAEYNLHMHEVEGRIFSNVGLIPDMDANVFFEKACYMSEYLGCILID